MTKHLFGPLISRRFGRSLGVDLCPFKTCSYDCVFCQLGRTTALTTERKDFFPVSSVCDQIAQWLRKGERADYITLAGSGEPTLYSSLGEVIDFVKQRTEIPVLVLSNGSMLWMPDVRQALKKADVAKISLSCWDEASFQCINRPSLELSFEQILEGEVAFRKESRNKLVLEVFLLKGINASTETMKKVAGLAQTIQPDTIHLNTVCRPAVEEFALAVSDEEMRTFSNCFKPQAEVVVAVDGNPVPDGHVDQGDVLALISRRPLTLEQLAGTFAVHPNEMAKITGQMLSRKEVTIIQQSGNTYFAPIRKT